MCENTSSEQKEIETQIKEKKTKIQELTKYLKEL